jgi:hypothetical protein
MLFMLWSEYGLKVSRDQPQAAIFKRSQRQNRAIADFAALATALVSKTADRQATGVC